jgi:hypothetical protein
MVLYTTRRDAYSARSPSASARARARASAPCKEIHMAQLSIASIASDAARSERLESVGSEDCAAYAAGPDTEDDQSCLRVVSFLFCFGFC